MRVKTFRIGILLALLVASRANPTDAPGKVALAVLPVMNFTDVARVGTALSEIIGVELLSSGLFELADEHELERRLERDRVRRMDLIPRKLIVAIGTELDVDALLVATVEAYRSDTTPKVTLSVSVYSASTGGRVWFSWDSLTADSAVGLFGIRKQLSAYDLSVVLIRRLLGRYAADVRRSL